MNSRLCWQAFRFQPALQSLSYKGLMATGSQETRVLPEKKIRPKFIIMNSRW